MNDAVPHTTQGQVSFAACGSTATPIFSVNPGIHVLDALAHSSNLQHIANQLMTDAALGDAGAHMAWAAVYLGEMAQAIVEDLTITAVTHQEV
ncbi:DUF3077 domain-containing protein [Pseudomonas sp. App30]|uniref:DUF3077 domain-containing protein n=1 Tax=Pseudomonas sp. App30 TaxID=3068990 RepID=UPI003A80FCB0